MTRDYGTERCVPGVMSMGQGYQEPVGSSTGCRVYSENRTKEPMKIMIYGLLLGCHCFAGEAV